MPLGPRPRRQMLPVTETHHFLLSAVSRTPLTWTTPPSPPVPRHTMSLLTSTCSVLSTPSSTCRARSRGPRRAGLKEAPPGHSAPQAPSPPQTHTDPPPLPHPPPFYATSDRLPTRGGVHSISIQGVNCHFKSIGIEMLASFLN